MMSQQDYENGLKVRTEVMGESFVKRAQDNTVPFTAPCKTGLMNMLGDLHGNVKVYYLVSIAH
jgi:hypothetical protein